MVHSVLLMYYSTDTVCQTRVFALQKVTFVCFSMTAPPCPKLNCTYSERDLYQCQVAQNSAWGRVALLTNFDAKVWKLSVFSNKLSFVLRLGVVYSTICSYYQLSCYGLWKYNNIPLIRNEKEQLILTFMFSKKIPFLRAPPPLEL